MKRYATIILFIFIAFTACKPNFDPSDDFKEVDVVYTILDPDSSIQYIQVGRGFLTKGENALDISKNTDSIYHTDSINVEILELENNGIITQSFKLKKQPFNNRKEGPFVNPEHFLYSTSSTIKIKDETKYKIRVTNVATQKTSFADIKTLQEFDYKEVFNGGISFSFINDNEIRDQRVDVGNTNGSGVIFEMNFVLPYLTFDKERNIIAKDTLVINIAKGKNAETGSKTTFIFSGETIINTILNEISPVPNSTFTREFGIIQVVTKCYSKEMAEYVLAENNFNSLSQTKPFYTNVLDEKSQEEQVGLVASVKEKSIVIFLANSTVKYVSSIKPELGFPQ